MPKCLQPKLALLVEFGLLWLLAHSGLELRRASRLLSSRSPKALRSQTRMPVTVAPTQVDLSNTKVEEIQEFTFAHCTSLKEVSFPQTLHTIRVKAFMNCAALLELAIQLSLKYILGRPSVAGPVFARVFGPQTGVQKNHFFRSLEGAKSLENL